ncbi:MAG: RNA methyltransferase [Halobacteriovoraceae bacterium]|nr:RNA methyltransferase [Halobacteriovoraceae bacterium]
MAFQIPPSAIKSFSKKQLVDTFYRLLKQMDAAAFDSTNWIENQSAYKSYLEILKTHETTSLVKLGEALGSSFPVDKKSLEFALMILERELQKDVPEDEFLISTTDTTVEKNKARIESLEIHLILDNLRSSFNVGSLFRSGEAFGVTKVHLCGYTATPENSKTAKAALGADEWIQWEYSEDTLKCIDNLKSSGFKIIALETVEGSVILDEWQPGSFFENKKVAVILGNERYGLGSPLLKRADQVLQISLVGRKNSLNVGVCGAIVLNWLRNKSVSHP